MSDYFKGPFTSEGKLDIETIQRAYVFLHSPERLRKEIELAEAARKYFFDEACRKLEEYERKLNELDI